MEAERQIRRDEGHVEEVHEAEPEFRTFDEVRGDAAEVADEDDDHEGGRFAVHALGAVGAYDRERPTEAKSE